MYVCIIMFVSLVNHVRGTIRVWYNPMTAYLFHLVPYIRRCSALAMPLRAATFTRSNRYTIQYNIADNGAIYYKVMSEFQSNYCFTSYFIIKG